MELRGGYRPRFEQIIQCEDQSPKTKKTVPCEIQNLSPFVRAAQRVGRPEGQRLYKLKAVPPAVP
jgi:hypothetical protein